MMKTQIGLGVLSIPAVLDTLGLVPGIICLWTIAIITTWSDYIVGTFKLRHPDVYSIDDVGYKLFGSVGREIFGLAFILCESGIQHLIYANVKSLDLRGWCRNAWYLNQLECCFYSWCLHSYLRGSRCNHWLLPVQHSDSESYLVARLGWPDWYSHCQ